MNLEGGHNSVYNTALSKKFIVSQLRRLEVQDQRVGRVGSFKGWEGERVPGLSPSFRWFTGHLVCSLACRSVTLSVFIFACVSLCVCPHFPFCIKTPLMVDEGPPCSSMMSYDHSLHLRDPIFKEGPIWRSWGLGCHYMKFGGHNSAHNRRFLP